MFKPGITEVKVIRQTGKTAVELKEDQTVGEISLTSVVLNLGVTLKCG